jgi:hypothetical protein
VIERRRPVVIPAGGNGGACCRAVTVNSTVTAVPQQKDSVQRKAQLRLNFYLAHVFPSSRKGFKYDTIC